ncbi:MAG: FtsW/RodA/SpoVE family cell cycle protein [Verrucomicrobia bacterium]|nr:FtsW/RodA/SpoVE family cell cycle protein [Verrucomicrobiota bacterium]
MLRRSSILLCVAVAALVALGLTMLTSTGAWVHGVEAPYFFLCKQASMAAVGLVMAVLVAQVSPELLRKYALLMLCISCVLLGLCFVPGIGVEVLGAKRWIHLPYLGQFQPSELSKVSVVIALAAWFARWQTEVHSCWRGFVMPGAMVAVPVMLIAVETDVGTALSLSVAVAAVLFCVGSRLLYIIPTAVTVMAGAAYYIRHNDNRWARILAWWDLEDPIHHSDQGMQQWRALLALGNGGPWGVGLGNGVEKFGTLTFAHIDFIFPVVGEELGLPFTLGVVFCYVLITVAGIGIAMQATTVFNRCLALGLTCVVVIPAMTNIAVTTAVIPNDGLPLPFVSFGGTSLIASLVAVGLLVGIHRRSQSDPAAEFPLQPKFRLPVRL